jgi:predicted ATPase
MVDLVPALAFGIGETEPLPPLAPRETQARLALALLRVMHGCAAVEHPLVIFLDDVQWSDAASVDLLDALICSQVSCG